MLIMLRLRLRLRLMLWLSRSPSNPAWPELTWSLLPLPPWLLPDRAQGQNAHALFGPAMSLKPTGGQCPLSVSRMPEIPRLPACNARQRGTSTDWTGPSWRFLLHPARTAHKPTKPTQHCPSVSSCVSGLVEGSA